MVVRDLLILSFVLLCTTDHFTSNPQDCIVDCKNPIHYILDPDFTDGERQLFHEATEIWQRGTGNRVCFEEGGPPGLTVIRLDSSDKLKEWDPEWSAQHIALMSHTRIWIVEPRIYDDDVFVAVSAHELGHYIGIGHIDDTADTYMHTVINDVPDDITQNRYLPARECAGLLPHPFMHV